MRSLGSLLFAVASAAIAAGCSPATNPLSDASGEHVSCDASLTACGSACTDLQSDPLHCGACDIACAPGELCVSGACRAQCSADQMVCGMGSSARCIDLRTDNANCGACGTACPAGQVCSAGACATTCGSGLTMCMQGGTSVCVDVRNDNANCGMCGRACAPGQACTGGACVVICPSGQSLCGTGTSTRCVYLMSDNANCGGCDAACAPGQSCVGGACTVTCIAGQLMCGTGSGLHCVDPQTDNANCGTCGIACVPGQICSTGHCVATTCPTGFSPCPTTSPTSCVDENVDPANCGACGVHCTAGPNQTAVCVSGHCATLCNAGYTDCNGLASDGCETGIAGDALNCGACGHACGTGSTCGSGACMPVPSAPSASCAAIHTSSPAAPSGVYPITTGSGSTATTWNAYCDMTDQGGGWTLIVKVAGGSTLFASTSGVWTTPFVFGTASTDLTHTEAKFQGFMNMSFNEVMLAFDTATAPAPPGLAAAPFTMMAMQASPIGVFSATTPTFVMGSGTSSLRATVLGLDPTFALQPNCNQAGFNIVGLGGAFVRFGMMGNNEADCLTNDSSVGIGAAHNTYCTYGSTTPTASSGCNCAAGCSACLTAAGTSPPSDPDIVQRFGYLFIR